MLEKVLQFFYFRQFKLTLGAGGYTKTLNTIFIYRMRKRDKYIMLHCDVTEWLWVLNILKYFVSLSVIESWFRISR